MGKKGVSKHPDISGSEQERQNDYFCHGAAHHSFCRSGIAPTDVQRVELDTLGEVPERLLVDMMIQTWL
jgi:hypothetical protein